MSEIPCCPCYKALKPPTQRGLCAVAPQAQWKPCMEAISVEEVVERVTRHVERPVDGADGLRVGFLRRYGTAWRAGIIAQDRDELWGLYREVLKLRPRNILEIGTRGSGWLYVMAGAGTKHARSLGVDIDTRFDGKRAEVKTLLLSEARQYDCIIGDSLLPETIERVKEMMPKVDLLHIDGLHTLAACTKDFENYAPLVRRGGMVVFHDSANPRERGPGLVVAGLKKALAKGGTYRYAKEWVTAYPSSMRCKRTGGIAMFVKDAKA